VTALLFPVREGKIHVFHKTIVDWLTGEIADGGSVRERSEIFQVRRSDGHATFARGFQAWLSARSEVPADAVEATAEAQYWLQHGIVHSCRADGMAVTAAEVYARDLPLLRQRTDAGLLASVAKDRLELRQCEGVDPAPVEEMKHFVGKYTDVLQREKGAAVLQLALQQPDDSGPFKAFVAAQPTKRILKWRNKPQQKDACIARLAHESGVRVLAVSATRIIGGSGNSLFVYDAETEELIEELEGTSEVTSVAICEGGKVAESRIVAGYEDGTIRVWGAPPAPDCQPQLPHH